MSTERWLLIGAGIVILYLLGKPSKCTASVTSTFIPGAPVGMDISANPGGAPVAANGSTALCQSLTGQGNAYWDPTAGYCLVTPA
jgi:hypothetical protein